MNVRLTKTQGRLLAALKAGGSVPTHQLVEAVWPANRRPADPQQNIRVHVSRLRALLAASGAPDTIQGIRLRGRHVEGYRLDA